MIQPPSNTARRVPPWVAVGLLVALLLLAGGIFWYVFGTGSSGVVLTDPAFVPGGRMTDRWAWDENTSGVRKTTDKEPADQWRIKSGRTIVDVVRPPDGKLQFRMGNRRGGAPRPNTRQDDLLNMQRQIVNNPLRYKFLNLTEQQLAALRSASGSGRFDLPADVAKALTDLWPQFEKATGEKKGTLEEQIVGQIRDLPQKQQQAIDARIELIRRTLTAEQIAAYERGPASRPATTRATP